MSNFSTARANSAVSRMSTSTPASPTTSGSDELLPVMTGAPQAIASSGGMPKPSNNDGNTNALHPEYSAGKSSVGT